MDIITGEEDVGNPLSMLFAYSAFFGVEVAALARNNCSVFYDNDNGSLFNFLGNNFFLIFVPVLIYLVFSEKSLLMKFTYSLGILPIILSFSYFSFITGIIYIKILVILIVNVCLIKYIHQVFILYKNNVIQNKVTIQRKSEKSEKSKKKDLTRFLRKIV